MELVHKTPVDDVPAALCPFQGRLLVGVGKLLRVYDLGKKKLLRKCENKHIPNMIVGIKCTHNRILVSDNQVKRFFRTCSNNLFTISYKLFTISMVCKYI